MSGIVRAGRNRSPAVTGESRKAVGAFFIPPPPRNFASPRSAAHLSLTGYCSAIDFWMNRENSENSIAFASSYVRRSKSRATWFVRSQLSDLEDPSEAEKRPFQRLMNMHKSASSFRFAGCGSKKVGRSWGGEKCP